MSARRSARAHGGQLGTGLSWIDLALLMVLSIGLFLVYPTLLWRAPAGSSHVGRFVVSYLAVVPAAAVLLFYRRRRVPLAELSTTVLVIWAIKMVVTVGLYHVMASKVRVVLEPHAAPSTFVHASGHHYRPIPDFTGRALAGRVVGGDGKPIAGVVVVLGGLAEGRPLPSSLQAPTLEVRAEGLAPKLQVVPFGASLQVENHSSKTVVVTGEHDGRSVFNVPVVPGEKPRRVRMNKLGLIELSLRVGDAAGAGWVLVVDHPYYAVTDSDGHFAFADAPVQSVGVTALRADLLPDGQAPTAAAVLAAEGEGAPADTSLEIVFTKDAQPLAEW